MATLSRLVLGVQQREQLFHSSPFILMLPNETVENTQSMRLTLKDISTVAKDFVRVIKLLTI